MRRRGTSSIAANPVLIGAATTLVVIVAVFLAYNANNGLPFVPTYTLKVDTPNAANLVRGNEVRIGGTRVGTISDIVPKRGADGRYYAQLELKLQTTVKPLPKDSTFLIRPRSALGLKYVEITEGTSNEGFADGATVPLANSKPQPVEIDEVLNMFDEPTRDASQVNLNEFGTALAGRGSDINLAIEAFNPLLTNLVPVMQNLSDRRTRLARLFQALGRSASIVAPAALTQAELFTNLSTTFGALANVTGDIQASIEEGPAALDAAIEGFPVQRRFLANSTGFFRELRPGVRALRTAAPVLADAAVAGQHSLRRSVQLNEDLKPTFEALVTFAEDPMTSLGVADLQTTSDILRPTVANLAPAQVTCNYITLFFRNIAGLLSEGDNRGTWQRFMVVAAPLGDNNEGGPSSKPANGPGRDNHLHANPYPNTASPGQPLECEAGNEQYLVGQTVIGNVPGTQQLATEKTTRSLDD
ncbi:MAG TPA: MlaD family protein [Capillimicrobium sp.]|nr:MlaD family protein [Capillimicrobium sp.]